MGFLAESRAQVVPRTLLVVLRVYLGVLFLRSALPKVQAGSEWAGRMAAFLERVLPRSYEFYRGFLEATVLPNKELVAFLVSWGEVLVGAALLLGVVTRLAALMGIVMTGNYLLAKGVSWLAASSHDALFILMLLVVLLGAAGRAYGVDYFLAKRWPQWPLW
ncbi:MAG: DoxX family protein [Terriglobia bacterium]